MKIEKKLDEYVINDNTNSLIMKLRSELDEIRKKYKGKLTRNTIKDEFKAQIGKV